MKPYFCLTAGLVAALFGMGRVCGEAADGAPQPGINKVLFIGNSITLNPPVEKLGWKGNWGMAASAPEKDYVHLFYDKLCAKQPDPLPELVISGRDVAEAGRLDQNVKNLDRLKAVNANLIVIQLGENEREADMPFFEELYERLVKGLKGDRSPIILCTGVWSPKATGPEAAEEKPESKDAIIRRVCERQGAHFVKIVPVPEGADAGSEKRYSNWGVNWHPGDKGMQHYAEALWKVAEPLLENREKLVAASPVPTAGSTIIARDDFDYQSEADLKAVWKFQASGFSSPLQVKLNENGGKNGTPCLELIVPPTDKNTKGRIILDAALKASMEDMKETRMAVFMDKSPTVYLAGQYFADKNWKNLFSRLVEIRATGDWQKLGVMRNELSQKSGDPSWSDIENMRFSMWIPPGNPEIRILIDEVEWDRQEEPLPLVKEWYN